jgi:hypothetical protein
MRARVPMAHHAQAHQMLALIERKAGHFSSALRSLWHAHDCRDGHPVHQAAILVSLAEVVAEAGEPCAAIRAWLSVLTDTGVPRLIVPCIIGLLGAFTRHAAHEDPCGDCARLLVQAPWTERSPSGNRPNASPSDAAWALDQVAQRAGAREPLVGLGIAPVTPHDEVELLLGRARLMAALGYAARATNLARAAEADATRWGFHERVFQSEDLLKLPAPPARPIAPRPLAAIRRFFTMGAAPVDRSAASV